MAPRTTRAMIDRIFENFVHAIGERVAKDYRDKGGLALDYNPVYGGYVIVQYLPSGGESHPFFSTRHSPAEFYDMLRFGYHAAVAAKRSQRR